MLRNYGQEKKYHHARIGYNRRLDNIQAALLRVKLKHLDGWNAARRVRAECYSRLLGDVVGIPMVADYADPVWHLYVVETDDRDGLQASSERAGHRDRHSLSDSHPSPAGLSQPRISTREISP